MYIYLYSNRFFAQEIKRGPDDFKLDVIEMKFINTTRDYKINRRTRKDIGDRCDTVI